MTILGPKIVGGSKESQKGVRAENGREGLEPPLISSPEHIVIWKMVSWTRVSGEAQPECSTVNTDMPHI